MLSKYYLLFISFMFSYPLPILNSRYYGTKMCITLFWSVQCRVDYSNIVCCNCSDSIILERGETAHWKTRINYVHLKRKKKIKKFRIQSNADFDEKFKLFMCWLSWYADEGWKYALMFYNVILFSRPSWLSG